ncbi:hypothetical protein [Cryobacterium sp. Y57]|uniref:hypothetical protein n=1 Tax=Cryobacterium sp. Y57 TaxID=2048287 RepID=UPI000CE2E82E|nr:hypothetical protein [Cryobacterium sp. Y57]
MILPKVAKPTKAQETDAYELATLRDLDTCQRCRRRCGPSNRDHRQNRSQGGLTIVCNLQVLGGTGTTGCHGWATAHPALAIQEGWACPGWADPSTWPARRWLPGNLGTLHLAWVIYDNEGGWLELTDEQAKAAMSGDGIIY